MNQKYKCDYSPKNTAIINAHVFIIMFKFGFIAVTWGFDDNNYLIRIHLNVALRLAGWNFNAFARLYTHEFMLSFTSRAMADIS